MGRQQVGCPFAVGELVRRSLSWAFGRRLEALMCRTKLSWSLKSGMVGVSW